MDGKFGKQAERNRQLDMLRGLAILIVVFGHSLQANIDSGYNSIWYLIRAFQMPLLFAISGYTCKYSFPCNNTRKFMVGKVKRILIPYLAWSSIHFFFLCILRYEVFTVNSFIYNYIISPFWFLRHLMVYFILFAIVNLLINCNGWIEIVNKEEYKNVFCVFLALIMMCFLLIIRKSPLVNQSNSVWQYLWFVAGFLVSVIEKNSYLLNRLKSLSHKSLYLMSSFIVILTIIIKILIKSEYIVCLFASISVYIISLALDKKCNEKMKTFICYVGRNTLPIYAIHWCLLFSTSLYNNKYCVLASKIGLATSVIITFLAWLIISFAMIWLFRKNKATRFILLGEK